MELYPLGERTSDHANKTRMLEVLVPKVVKNSIQRENVALLRTKFTIKGFFPNAAQIAL